MVRCSAGVVVVSRLRCIDSARVRERCVTRAASSAGPARSATSRASAFSSSVWSPRSVVVTSVSSPNVRPRPVSGSDTTPCGRSSRRISRAGLVEAGAEGGGRVGSEIGRPAEREGGDCGRGRRVAVGPADRAQVPVLLDDGDRAPVGQAGHDPVGQEAQRRVRVGHAGEFLGELGQEHAAVARRPGQLGELGGLPRRSASSRSVWSTTSRHSVGSPVLVRTSRA